MDKWRLFIYLFIFPFIRTEGSYFREIFKLKSELLLLYLFRIGSQNTTSCCLSMSVLHVKVNDDRIILDKTVADQVSMWKSSKGLTDKVVTDHACSGETCSYYHIGDVFICEKTGQVHGREQLFSEWQLFYVLIYTSI
jgi:uncharacterized protein YrrD